MFKCKNCVFYTGVQCHGHGEFWGQCKLIHIFLKSNNLNRRDYDVWSDVKDDDSICFFNDIIKLKDSDFFVVGDSDE